MGSVTVIDLGSPMFQQLILDCVGDECMVSSAKDREAAGAPARLQAVSEGLVLVRMASDQTPLCAEPKLVTIPSRGLQFECPVSLFDSEHEYWLGRPYWAVLTEEAGNTLHQVDLPARFLIDGDLIWQSGAIVGLNDRRVEFLTDAPVCTAVAADLRVTVTYNPLPVFVRIRITGMEECGGYRRVKARILNLSFQTEYALAREVGVTALSTRRLNEKE